jgi:hypothetical protein
MLTIGPAVAPLFWLWLIEIDLLTVAGPELGHVRAEPAGGRGECRLHLTYQRVAVGDQVGPGLRLVRRRLGAHQRVVVVDGEIGRLTNGLQGHDAPPTGSTASGRATQVAPIAARCTATGKISGTSRA